jgi:predicted RND superfamily exporter protein
MRHPRAILVGAAVLALVGAAFASRLKLRTDWAELLPQDEPSVRAIRHATQRMPGMAALIVNVYSPDRAANERFADDLAARLRTLPKSVVELAISNFAAEASWLRAHRWLYASLADLSDLRDRLTLELQRRKNPLLLDLDDQTPPLADIEHRLSRRAVALGTLASGRLTTADGQTSAVLVIPPGGLFGERAGEQVAREVRKAVAALDPTRYGRLEVGLSGELESALEERAALEKDLILATAICLFLVGAAVWAYYGRLRAVALMGLPATLGAALAFALAQWVFGYVNSSTAFLGSIILGNGINFAIILLARYEEERRGGATVRTALRRARRRTLRPTAVAALSAGIAYASLAVTRFRGFSQFGIIGGAGMLLCWAASMLVLPAFLLLVDQRRTARGRGPLEAFRLARAVTGRPRVVLALAGVVTVAALAALPRRIRDPFEYDFRQLRSARGESQSGEARWRAANEELFGRALGPVLVLAHSREQAEAVRASVLASDRRGSGPPLVAAVVTARDLVPDPGEQGAKLAILAQLHRLAGDPGLRLLDDSERAAIERNLPPPDLAPIATADVPELLRRPLTERAGTFGRVALILPARKYSSWDGRDMLRLAERVANIPLPDGTVLHGAGKALVFADMIRAIVRDGPRAIAVAGIGVAIVVLLLARGARAALLVLGALALGLCWTAGAVAALGLRLNFLNFVALPITVGVGVDYAINVYLRYRSDGARQAARAVARTGGAVTLCSATTIIGYGSLLLADNRALRSFGLVAILGEVACLTAALMVVPALLEWRDRRAGAAAPVGTRMSVVAELARNANGSVTGGSADSPPALD